jgi:hypothetical protein
MQIRNTIHINSNKKTYRKPVLEVVDIDREIILMNQSMGPPPGPGSVKSFSETGTSSSLPSYDKSQQYPKDNSPFGGGTPSYER